MRIVGLAMLAACGFSSPSSGNQPGDGGARDSTKGDNGDAPLPSDAATCFGSDPEDTICLASPPGGSVLLDGTLDTGTSPMCAAVKSGPSACVIAGTTVTVLSLDVSGSRPLAIIGATAIAVTTKLDVASHVAGKTGPAANPADCGPTSNPAAGGAGGGAGGSFGDIGGDGGDDDNNRSGGTAGTAMTPSALHGGCNGDRGGAGGNGGAGGGVALLIAPSISIDGHINASGAGGKGAPQSGFHGGGGGGTGGMILVDAGTLSGIGAIFANGGGGGGSSNGEDGHDPDPLTPTTRASGGAGGGQGGGGSSGGAGTQTKGLAGSNGTASDGGGGGGGGVGIVTFFRATFAGTVSPH